MDAVVMNELGFKDDTASATGTVHAKLASVLASSIIKSIQRGTIVVSVISETATISAVDTSKAMVNFLGASSNGLRERNDYDGTSYAKTGHHFVRLQLTNSTTVTANRYNGDSPPATVSYEVIEFY